MTTEGPHHVGVDWSSGAWLAIAYCDRGKPEVEVFEEFSELWNEFEKTAERIAVDVPIGLCESIELGEDCGCVLEDGELSRRCDDLARTVIGKRTSSVFTTPARESVRMSSMGESYDEVNSKNRELTGKGLMRQAASIASGILEVERVILDDDAQDVIVESHPEVCFRAFNDAPLHFSKKYAAGVEERIRALENVVEYEAGTWREVANDLRSENHKVKLDDVLDGLALALTARAGKDEYRTIPERPPRDRMGLPMQMVYRSKTPLI